MERKFYWDAVKERNADDLREGDIIVVPFCGTAYHASSAGDVRGHGWTPLEGIAWTVTGREGITVHAKSDDREISQDIPPGKKVILLMS